MNETEFEPDLNPELERRTGYIEGRPELYETKVMEIVSDNEAEDNSNGHEILAVSRDPGSATCLFPVIKELAHRPGFRTSIISDGRAEETIRQNFEVAEHDVSQSLGADKAIAKPDLILMATAEEMGIETYADATFKEVPSVLIEDYPGATHIFLRACLDRPGLHLPDKICVMDEAAKELMVQAFPDNPELESRIEVTGQPAFDRIAKEDIAEISRAARDQLGLSQEEKVVSFMSTINTKEEVEAICKQLKQASTDFTFIFRRHPRDNTTYEEFFQIFEDNGIKYVDSRELTTDQVSAMSDVVMTTWSTAGLEAIYRGKPTIHVVDPNVLNIPAGLALPMPVIKLGASVGVEDVNELPGDIDQLFDPESPLRQGINSSMAAHYPNDGKNASRAADVINDLVKTGENA